MKILNVAEARNGFSALVDEIHAGAESVVIAKYGRPMVVIMPIPEDKTEATRHPLRGMSYRMSDDFDAPMEDLWDAVAEGGAPAYDAAAKPRRKGAKKCR